MSNPLVSICLPTYNYAHYLPEAISSCLRQTHEPLEVVVVDDASTDNTREVVGSFGDPRIRFTENAERLGLAGNWNKALSLVRGEIVKFLFADDYLADDAIEAVAAAFRDPGVDLVFSSARVIDGEGRYVYTHEPYPDSRRLPGPQEAKGCLLRGNYIGGPTSVAVRTSAFSKVGAFNEALGYSPDVDMWIRILLAGDAYFLSAPLVSVRQHDGSETRRLERAKLIEAETLNFLNVCLRNEQLLSLLSESELAELERQREALLHPAAPADRQVPLGALRAKIPPRIKRVLSPLYKKLRAAGEKTGGGS